MIDTTTEIISEEALEVYETKPVAHLEDFAMGKETLLKQVSIIQDVMENVMQEGQHYGVIPGTDKPTLLKPGAEKLTMTFRFAPRFHVTTRDLGNNHREYEVRTELFSIITREFVGEGVGSCSTMEAKYRFRKAEAECPECHKNTIIKGKKQYGGGWLCWKKKGGCGAKFEDGDPRIENQEMGRVEYDNPADYYNTCLKMGKKRSLVDATLTATAASDIFTQDVEDLPQETLDSGREATKQNGNGKVEPRSSKQANKLYAMMNEAKLEIDKFQDFLLDHYESISGETKDGTEKKVLTKHAMMRIFDNWDDILVEYRVGQSPEKTEVEVG